MFVMVVLGGCTGAETGEDDPAAVAVEPDHSDHHEGNEGGSEATGSVDLAAAHDGMVCDIEAGLSQTIFSVEAADAEVRTCCDEADLCQSELYFADEDQSLIIDGVALQPAYFSVDGQSVVTMPAALAPEDEIVVVDRQQLVDLSAPADATTPVVGPEELVQRAQWQLAVERLHRVESLSARAVDEAAAACEWGVHLPTMLELAEQGEPISEALTIEFERWAQPQDMILSTRGDVPGWTTMIVDADSLCMERTSTNEARPSISAQAAVEEGFDWELDDAVRVEADGENWAVIRGVFVQEKGPDAPQVPAEVGAIVDRMTGQALDDEVYVVHRHVDTGEVDWWVDLGGRPDLLDDPALQEPAREYADVWQRRVTVFVGGVADEVGVELFAQ